MRLGYYYPISQIRKLRLRPFTLSKAIQLECWNQDSNLSLPGIGAWQHGLQTEATSVQIPPRPLTTFCVSSLNLLICKIGVMMMMIPTTLGTVVGIQQVLNKS